MLGDAHPQLLGVHAASRSTPSLQDDRLEAEAAQLAGSCQTWSMAGAFDQPQRGHARRSQSSRRACMPMETVPYRFPALCSIQFINDQVSCEPDLPAKPAPTTMMVPLV